jgi:hypothetical protein
MRRLHVLGGLAALLLAAPAAAHQDTVAYSRMVIRENGDVEYALKIPVEDLAEALGRRDHTALDAPEVRGAEQQLFRHFQPLVGMTAAGARCPVERNGIDVPEDERLYGEMRFVFHCVPGAPVTLDYRVFFDVDPGHMGMLEVETPGGKGRAELIIERPRWEVHAPADGPPQLQVVRVVQVETTAALPTENGRPVASAKSAKSTIAEPTRGAEEARLATKPEARRVSDVQERAKKPSRPHGNWIPLALVVAVGAVGTFLAMRAARRRTSLPSR